MLKFLRFPSSPQIQNPKKLPDQFHRILILSIFLSHQPDLTIGPLADLSNHVKRIYVDPFRLLLVALVPLASVLSRVVRDAFPHIPLILTLYIRVFPYILL